MYIKKIELKNYRNYEDLSLEFDQKVNLIVGHNAQGKTNLIEAVYLSSIGRSFRTAHDSDLIRFGNNFATVKVHAQKEYTDTKVEIILKRNAGKSIRKDGSVIHRTSQLLENIIVVDTKDAILICDKEHAGEIKTVMAQLEENGRTELL